MSFRTVVIKTHCKLDVRMNYLVYRGERETRIFLPEISVLIIENTATSLTAALLSALIKNKTKVIFCDEKHSPESQLVGFYDNFHTSKQVLAQINWSEKNKGLVWKDIIEHKIGNQQKVLFKYNLKQSELLDEYKLAVAEDDITNREGHSAKVYFNALFGNTGRRVPAFFNTALNYGYAVLLSAFCREITSRGYITQLGIWHKSEFNYFNLGSDLMESFRPIVDEAVLELKDEDLEGFKPKMANIMNTVVMIGGKKLFLEDAISTYCGGVFRAVESGDIRCIQNFEDYELPIYENYSDV